MSKRRYGEYVGVRRWSAWIVLGCVLALLAENAEAASSAASQIAFARQEESSGGLRIFVTDPEGTGAFGITQPGSHFRNPEISPDGTRIVFNGNPDGSVGTGINIWVFHVPSGHLKKLTDSGSDGDATWSPDGTRIAFASDRTGNAQIFVMNADGSGVTQITDNAFDDYQPAWSPDGSKIAFASERPGHSTILVINADGTGEHQLVDHWSYMPDWSPDGSRIAFAAADGLYSQIHLINADGSNEAAITSGTRFAYSPSWSPDGARLAYSDDVRPFNEPVGDFEIYTMNPDGTGVVQVTNNTIVDSDSDWGPVLAAGPNPAGPVGGVVDVVVATDGGGSTRWVVVSLMLALPMVFWRLRAGSSDPQPV